MVHRLGSWNPFLSRFAACIGKAGSLVLHSCLSSFLLSRCAVVVVVVSGAFSSSLDIRLHDTNRNSIVAFRFTPRNQESPVLLLTDETNSYCHAPSTRYNHKLDTEVVPLPQVHHGGTWQPHVGLLESFERSSTGPTFCTSLNYNTAQCAALCMDQQSAVRS